MSNNQLNNVCLSKASDQLTKLYPSNNDNTRNDSSLHNLTPSALDNWMPSNIEQNLEVLFSVLKKCSIDDKIFSNLKTLFPYI